MLIRGSLGSQNSDLLVDCGACCTILKRQYVTKSKSNDDFQPNVVGATGDCLTILGKCKEIIEFKTIKGVIIACPYE